MATEAGRRQRATGALFWSLLGVTATSCWSSTPVGWPCPVHGVANSVGVVPISPDTLLRILHSLADDEQHQRGPRVLGVDDVAVRRNQRR